jgi:cytochrome c553
LRGLDLAPPLAGRSPTYLLRQLVAFRTGARYSREALSMKAVVDSLTLDDMIAAAAYAASLQP